MDCKENICRICLQSRASLISLFSKRQGRSIYESFSVTLKIDLCSFGPSFLCSQCLSELDTTLKFLEKCERSNKVLASSSKHIKNQESPKESSRSPFQNSYNILMKQHEINDSEPLEESESFQINETITFKNSCTDCGSQRRCRHRTPPTLTCTYCHKVFTRKYNLDNHLKHHSGNYEWPCPICGALKLTPWQAKTHCAPRHLCPKQGCGKTFTSKHNLNSHVRRHTGERPFECADCGKTFTCKTTLTDHVRIHTGAKPYICPVCGKRFTTNKLTLHLRTHSDERPYSCPVLTCTRTFRSPRASTLHALSHAPGPRRALPCPLCAARYSHTQSLNRHMKRQHGEIQNQPHTRDVNATQS